jgi:hypothetical protein
MALPTISTLNPSSSPAIPAMTYSEAFLTLLSFQASSPSDKWSLQMNTRNYNAASNIMSPNGSDIHVTRLLDVGDYASQYPVFAQTLGAVLVTAGLVQNEQHAQRDVASANSSLSAANGLPDSDSTKTDKIAAATTLLASANQNLTAAKIALGATA